MKKHIVFVELSMTGAGEKAIEYSLKQGYKVGLIVKKQPNIPYLEKIDIYLCDTNNYEHLLRTVLTINQNDKIDGITTTADFYVPQASFLAQQLNLTSLSYKAAMSVRNKYMMRKTISVNYQQLNPQFTLAKNILEADKFASSVGYPLIAKPQDGNDSLYVQKIEDLKDLEVYFKSFEERRKALNMENSCDSILLESYLDGEEYTVETINTKDGNIQCIGILEKYLCGVEYGNFVEIGVGFSLKGEIGN